MRVPARISSIRRNRSYDQLLAYHKALTSLVGEMDRIIAADQNNREWAASERLRYFIAAWDRLGRS